MMELNGKPVAAEDLGSLGLVNYGNFTSMRVDDLRVRGLSLHLDRLARDCRALFGTDLDTGRVRHLARRVAQATGGTMVVRVTVFDPTLQLGRPVDTGEPQILITTRSAADGDLPAVRLATVRYERDLPSVKHVGLFATLHHRRKAQLDGYDDVLFVDDASRISEVATSNIAFVRDGRVWWPRAECLQGVTMQLLQDLMRQMEIPYDIAPIEVEQIPEFHSAFITNAAVGLRSVGTIDSMVLREDASLLAMLRKEYAALAGDPV